VVKSLWLGLVLLGPGMAGDPQARGEVGRPDRLYFFFSPDTGPDAARKVVTFAKAQARTIEVRPVILVEDWTKIRKVAEDSPLLQVVRELGRLREPEGVDIRLFDEEGLRLARLWNLSRLPASVLVAHGHAHVVQGSQSAPGSLLGCDR
jgi:hypothetical protein